MKRSGLLIGGGLLCLIGLIGVQILTQDQAVRGQIDCQSAVPFEDDPSIMVEYCDDGAYIINQDGSRTFVNTGTCNIHGERVSLSSCNPN